MMMRCILAAGCMVGVSSAWAGEWVSLFNGKDLSGWEQLNGTAEYQVEDGAIVGTTVPGSPNSFLCTVGDYGDFEMTFEVKVDTGLNSGVQIRSRVRGQEPSGKTPTKNAQRGRYFGPQVEIEAGPGQAGYIYGEAMGTGWLSPEPDAGGDKAEHELFKNDAWNQYRIIAKGPTIRTFINGQPIADLTDEKAFASHPKGSIGLQVHSIPKGEGPYQVRWRNLKIRE